MTAMLLLIDDVPEAIQYTQVIPDFTMLAQYVLHDEEIFCYIEYVLYRLEKTKIAFEQHRFIDSKLCQPTFNYPKFYVINHFVCQDLKEINSIWVILKESKSWGEKKEERKTRYIA